MKRILILASVLTISMPAQDMNLLAMEHSAMDHSAMQSKGGVDSRVELKLPAPMKVKQKAMMRSHLDTVSSITLALAENRLEDAATIAGSIGWSPEEEKQCTAVSEKTGEADFLTLGKALHRKADELAGAAAAGRRDEAMVHLSELITRCNACHYKFRH